VNPQGIASRSVVRCVACKEQGKTRDFRTASGFLSHLRSYHNAKETDFVRKQERTDG
jgi:hypothetical protein